MFQFCFLTLFILLCYGDDSGAFTFTFTGACIDQDDVFDINYLVDSSWSVDDAQMDIVKEFIKDQMDSNS